MTAAVPVPTVSISTAASLIALVRNQLGFHPAESAVLMFLKGSRLTVTARIELSDLDDERRHHQLAQAARHTEADAYLVVTFDAEERHLDALHTIDVMLRDINVRRRELVLVTGDSWYSMTHGEQGSLDEVATDAIAVEALVEGRGPASSREELARQLDPGTDEEPEGYAEHYDSMAACVAGMTTDRQITALGVVLDEWLDSGLDSDARTLGQVAALIDDRATTESVLARIRTDSAGRWYELWSRLARLSHDDAAVVPLVAAGCTSWAVGNGALMNIAVDEIRALGCQHPMVRVKRPGFCSVVRRSLARSSWCECRTLRLLRGCGSRELRGGGRCSTSGPSPWWRSRRPRWTPRSAGSGSARP